MTSTTRKRDGIHYKTIDQRRISWWCRRVIVCSEPSTRSIIYEVAKATADQVEEAVRAAREAWYILLFEYTKKSTTTSFDNLLENPEKTMTSMIKRVASGTELSKSISYEESRAGMRLVLEGLADPVQGAVFLIGLWMNRENDDENKVILQGIHDKTKTVVADVDVFVDIADTYYIPFELNMFLQFRPDHVKISLIM